MILRYLLLLCCGLHTLSACAQTAGQYQVLKRRSDGKYDSYGVTLANGQVIGQTAGVPAAITVGGGSGGAAAWGTIEGILADQADLIAALNAKLSTATAASTYQPLITDGSLTIARTNGLQAALDAKLSTATAASTYQLLITDGSLTIARTNGLQAALDAKLSTATAASTYQPLIGTGTLALSKLATDPLARANHTGTQAWSTITSTPTTLAGYGITDSITAALAASTYQPLIADGGLAIAKTSGLQTALDGKLSTATAASTYQPLIADGALTIAKTSGLQTALDGKQATSANLATYSGIAPSANVQTLLGAANYAAFKASLSLGNVENTALSTWAGSTNVTTLGTISAGTWNGSIIAPAYLGTGSSISAKFLRGDGTWQTVSSSGATWGAVTGTLADQTDLQAALDAKQATITDGSLTIAKTNGLQSALDAKQATITDGSLTIARTSGLQSALNGKLDASGGGASGLVSFSILNSGTGAYNFQINHVGTLTDSHTLTFNLNNLERTVSLSGNLTVPGDATVSGTNTGDQTSVTGNAGTATALATGRTLAITGDLVWTSPSFNGSANVTAAGTLATVNSNVGSFGSATAVPAITVNAKGLITAVTTSTVTPAVGSITGLGTGIAAALAINTGSAGAPVLFNGAGGTPSSIVLTNASGTASNLTAGSASTLATGRTIAITGDLTWTSPSFNGSANVTAAGTLASTGVTAGSYTSADITVDAKGRITAAANGSGGGGGLTGFTGSLATTSPNNTVNASMLAASGGTTNQDAVIAPKGTGALIGFGIPDNTGTGGAKRGDYAVDFQGPFRNNSADIASGSSSAILGGRYNKATGSYALAFGYLSAATGSSAPIALGYQSTASASYAAAIGGIGNNASGASSSAIGGQSNTASGANAAAFGGQSNTASASYAYAFGYYSVADRYGMQAKASGQFAAAGDAQAVQFILRCKTTTNAAVEMKLDGSSTRLTIPAGKALYGTVKIIGMKSDGSVAATYTRQVAIKNAAGTTSLIGTVNTLGTDEAGSTSISITADDTNDALNISPTGITSETWRWVAVFEGVEIAYGS